MSPGRPLLRRLAFVLAGGGSLGAVQVGMLAALARRGIVPELIVGASVGAINGACFAMDPTSRGIARLKEIWSRLSSRDVFPFSPLNLLLGVLGRRDHLVTARRLRSLLQRELGEHLLEHGQIPCHVIATDVLSGSEVVIGSGRAVPALMASAAIPAVFPVVGSGNRYLMDGGVSNNTPISTAVRLGARSIVVLPTGMPCALTAPPRSAAAIGLHALNLLIMQQLVADIDRFRARVALAIVPPLCPLTVSPYDFTKSAELIRRAEATTRLWLKQGGLHRTGPEPGLLVHHHQEPARDVPQGRSREPSPAIGETS